MQSVDAPGRHAVVIGAGVGGLIAARVLSSRFDKVTLVERDELPAQPANRRGVPQGRHIHGLLGGGRQALETLYPGITDEWLARGALLGDVTDDVLWCNEGAFHARFHSGLTGVVLSRPLLEFQVRTRTLALPNVHLRRGEASGLAIDHSARRVRGVEVRSDSAESEMLPADLVVDASGRGTRALTWLAAAGLPLPEEEKVDINLAYTTRYYRRRPGDLGELRGVVDVGTVENPRSGAILAQEDERWVVTLIGYAGDAAPADADGYLAYARTLHIPHIASFLATAEPVTDFYVAHFASNQRRRFERLATPAAGYLAFGDSISSLNPLYGQGMTIAAMAGLALQKCLTSGAHDLERRFYAAAGRLIDVPWSIAVANDLRIPGVVGKRTAMVRFINWYIARLHRAAWNDPVLALAFQRVANLLSAPPSLFAPHLVLRVFRPTHAAAMRASIDDDRTPSPVRSD